MKKFLSIAALALFAISAQANRPSGPPAGNGQVGSTCSIADVSNSFACAGSFSGNDNTDVVGKFVTLSGLFGPDVSGWKLIDKTDSATGTQAVQITSTGAKSGTLSFSQPIYSVFGISLKAADSFSIYLLDGGQFLSGLSSVSFVTNGVSKNGNGIPADLSHASLWGFTPSTGTYGCGGGVCAPVPEPQSYALMAAGLIGLGFFLRRKRS